MAGASAWVGAGIDNRSTRLFIFGWQLSEPSSLRIHSGCFRRGPSTNHLTVFVDNLGPVGALPKRELIEPGSMDARGLDFHNGESDTSM